MGENEGEVEKGEHKKEGAPSLHFFDCIVQGEGGGAKGCGANVVLSCLEAALHALKQKFPHVTKLIVQSDNAKHLAGKQTKLLLPYVCSAAGLKLIAYYHNKAQSSKDACDTHFSYQQTQSGCLPDAGDEGRNVSTPRQLAVALINASVSNTTKLSGSCSDSSGGWNFQVLCCPVCNICRKATGPCSFTIASDR